MRNLSILFTLATIGLVLAACGGAAAPSSPAPSQPPTTTPAAPAPPAATIDTKKLYDTNCAMCHGQTREGMTGLAPALTPTSLANDSLDEIKTDISKGKTGTAMSGYEGRLSATEIDALAQFIKNTAP